MVSNLEHQIIISNDQSAWLCCLSLTGTRNIWACIFWEKGSTKPVAIKCIMKSKLGKQARDNLVSEISILKALEHPHIVCMLDFTWDSSFVYIIMEFCGGGDLSRYMKQKRKLDELLVQHFLQQLALALQYLKSKNIVHMDLKPQNILLTSVNHPSLKLADFGFAQCIKEIAKRNEVRGTLLYMAPEIFREGVYHPSCDLWSIGIILYECLFGTSPYGHITVEELKENLLSDKPIEFPSTSDISEPCAALLRDLLKRNPSERLNHEQFFSHPFIDLDHLPSAQSMDKALKYYLLKTESLKLELCFTSHANVDSSSSSQLKAINPNNQTFHLPDPIVPSKVNMNSSDKNPPHLSTKGKDDCQVRSNSLPTSNVCHRPLNAITSSDSKYFKGELSLTDSVEGIDDCLSSDKTGIVTRIKHWFSRQNAKKKNTYEPKGRNNRIPTALLVDVDHTDSTHLSTESRNSLPPKIPSPTSSCCNAANPTEKEEQYLTQNQSVNSSTTEPTIISHTISSSLDSTKFTNTQLESEPSAKSVDVLDGLMERIDRSHLLEPDTSNDVVVSFLNKFNELVRIVFFFL
ncbi:Serine/threonine-protein kinase ULK3 [Schistosoma japonicum]|nr:Serine/threonine-protein kinase ULK3 [Schistosoma japonicum]